MRQQELGAAASLGSQLAAAASHAASHVTAPLRRRNAASREGSAADAASSESAPRHSRSHRASLFQLASAEAPAPPPPLAGLAPSPPSPLTEASRPPPAPAPPAEAGPARGERILISEVELKGATGELASVAAAALTIKPNFAYTLEEVQEDVNRVFQTGFFSSCAPLAEDTRDGVRVTLELKPNPQARAAVSAGCPAAALSLPLPGSPPPS